LLRTLHTYIGRDLAKVAILALAAFTLVMTVFAIIEPLRKQGLEADKVLALIAYTLPVMLSLTMPIAALFAATIVYGRFSQDNELMACRASGVAMIALMKPALLLGITVTAASLWLSNFVTPGLAERAAMAVKENVRGIIYHQIRTQGYVSRGRRIVHATRVHPKSNVLEGVVAVERGTKGEISIVTARRADVTFRPAGKETFVLLTLQDPMLVRRGERSTAREKKLEIPREFRLENPFSEDPAWYRWSRLLETLKDPAKNRDIQRALEKIKQEIAGEMLAKEVVAAIHDRNVYDRLEGQGKKCVLSAGAGRVVGRAAELYSAPGKDGKPRPVKAVVTEGGTVKTFLADMARVEVDPQWQPLLGKSIVSVELLPKGPDGKVWVWTGDPDSKSPGSDQPSGKAKHILGKLDLPKTVARTLEHIDLGKMYADPEQFTRDPGILAEIEGLQRYGIRRLTGKILGEMHGRVAYGLSCFLMVALGAALGMLFRGGQVLSAFALCVMPAAMVIVMVLMGKEMVANPDVPRPAGLACIWGGIIALILGNAYIFLYRLRR